MEPVATIRSENRNIFSNHIKVKRTLELDRRRLIDSASESSANIEEIIKKLKKKSHVRAEEMSALKSALLTEINIATFMKTDGALRGIIREFTGVEPEKQLAAAGCLCNLALSEPRLASVIAKAAGSYLFTYINSLNTELVILCAWTVGNLAASHKRVCHILLTQGALSALLTLLAQSTDTDVDEALYYALIRIAYTLDDDLQPEACQKLLEVLKTKSRTTSFHHLVFILSCHDNFLNLESSCDIFNALLEDIFDSEFSSSEQQNCIVKSLANMCVAKEWSDCALKYWRERNSFIKFETVLLNKINTLHSNTLWLLGNIFTTCTLTMENVHLFQSISDKIVNTNNDIN